MSIFAQKSSKKNCQASFRVSNQTNSIILPSHQFQCPMHWRSCVVCSSNVDCGKCCKINSVCNRSMWHIGVLINQLGAVNHLKRNCQYPFIKIHFSRSTVSGCAFRVSVAYGWTAHRFVVRVNKNQFQEPTRCSSNGGRQRQYCHRQTVYLVTWKPIYTAYTIHIPPFWI